MEQQHRAELLKLMGRVYETPSLLEEYWESVTPLLIELKSTAPNGLEGMAGMISRHCYNAEKFNDAKVKAFELESALMKLQTYFRKLSAFDKPSD